MIAYRRNPPVRPSVTGPLTIIDIQRRVARYYGLPFDAMPGRGNERLIAWPRQTAMYLSRQLTRASFPQIGRRFGGRDHATVIHAVRSVTERRAKFPEFDRQVRELEALL